MTDPRPRAIILAPVDLSRHVRTVPVAASLRLSFSDLEIHWVTSPDLRGAIEAHPAIDVVHTFPDHRGTGRSSPLTGALATWRFGRALSCVPYDILVDACGDTRNGLLRRAIRTNRHIRIATDERGQAAGAAEGRHPIHEIDRQLAPLAAAGVQTTNDATLYVTDADRQWWRDARQARGVGGSRYAVLGPTARWKAKRWPIDRWIALIDPLLMRGFEKIIILGPAAEAEQACPLVPKVPPGTDDGDIPIVDLLGETTVGQAMAIIAQADLVIAGDTGLLAVAAGLHRPLVGLFGPTDPAITGLYRHEEGTLRMFRPRPGEIVDYRDPAIGDALMRVISTSRVIQKVDEVLARPSRSKAGETSVARSVAKEAL